MRVTTMDGKEMEALGPVLYGGAGELYLVNGEWVPAHRFRASYILQPERRLHHRRVGQRRRNRMESRRSRCRRERDTLTERECLARARGAEHTV